MTACIAYDRISMTIQPNGNTTTRIRTGRTDRRSSGWNILDRSAAILFGLLLLAPILTASPHVSAAPERQAVAGFWHTSGTHILDAHNLPVRMSGVTWYGMETTRWVPAGLDFQPYTTIMDLVKLLGYVTIRLPFSNELVERNPVVQSGVAANPELRGKRALDVMDLIAGYAEQIGLKILLDDQRSRAARPMEINTPNEPLWHSPGYSTASWIQDWQTLARRYQSNDAVIGFDLRNEPHAWGSGPWNLAAYLHRSATWGPYGGVEHAATDWRLAAQRAGNAVLAINPHLLIVVEGLQLYPDSSQPGGVASSWWAGLLTPVRSYPLELSVPHQLVYSIHEYGPRKYPMPWFRGMAQGSLQRAWEKQWAFLLDDPAVGYAAPVLLGEFGTCNAGPQCVKGATPDDQGTWFTLLVRFLQQHQEVAWSFFALDGTNANNCRTDNSLLNVRWDMVSAPALQARLRSIQDVPGVLPTSTSTPLIPGATITRAPRSPSSPLCQLP
jgi:endoglucanase